MNSNQTRVCGYAKAGKGANWALVATLLYGATQSSLAFAQAPLNIDALMAARSELTLQVGYSFLAASNHVLVPLASGQAAGLAQSQGVVEQNIESGQWVSALRYGLNSNLELRSTVRQRDSRIRSPYQPSSTGRSAALAMGGSWQVSRDQRTPALLLSLDLDIAARSPLQDNEIGYGKAVRLAAMTYRSIDPVVLSLHVGLEHFSSWRHDGTEYQPGASANTRAQVSFAVNPEVTLISGLAVQRAEPAKISGNEIFEDATRIALLMSTGVALSRRSSLFLGADIAVSGSSGASINLEWLYQFEL